MTAPYVVLCNRESPEWHALRAGGVGASESASLMGCGYDSEDALRMKKLGLADKEEPNRAMVGGTFLQQGILDLYNWEHGTAAVEWEETLRSVLTPCMTATPDARDGETLIEIKAPTLGGLKKWSDGPPVHYWNQVQHLLYVTGFERAELLCLRPDYSGYCVDVFPIERDELYVADLVDACVAFWRRVEADKEEMTTLTNKRTGTGD